jgi:hypothetical protein
MNWFSSLPSSLPTLSNVTGFFSSKSNAGISNARTSNAGSKSNGSNVTKTNVRPNAGTSNPTVGGYKRRTKRNKKKNRSRK